MQLRVAVRGLREAAACSCMGAVVLLLRGGCMGTVCRGGVQRRGGGVGAAWGRRVAARGWRGRSVAGASCGMGRALWGGVQGRGGYGDLRGDYVRAVWRGVVAAALLRVWGLRGLRRGGCVGVAWARRGGCMGAAWGWRGGGFWEQLGGCVLVVWGRYAAACVAWQLRGSGVAAVRGQCGGHLWAV